MPGKIVVIGGAEDRKRRCTVLKSVLELSGEDNPRISVIAAASSTPEETGEDYEAVFGELGAASVRVLKLSSRESARDRAAIDSLQEASIIFLTGGDQLRLTGILGGTPLLEKLWSRFREGAIVAGTSAGASALSGTMINSGGSEAPPQRGHIYLSPGLGFLPQVIVDQHFSQRGRFGRLMAAVSFNPSLLGLGIDEDTAVVVTENRWLKVIGSSGVNVIDGAPLEYTNVYETAPRETLTLSAFRLHVLANGSQFDLQGKKLVVPHA
ncbi:MAG TPA: cyanophycinase [Bacillota bacterium]|jgi:cyanophycinase|nr:cyanophycinase [Bacillota bacterium]HOB86128.1 cyanophycinase [Bacillota bacterium]HOP69859.1 cyanophycinase [Bacillota bacterium]HPT34597.1 cyanophycinase [Bacillota bacterium]HPZ64047.1 cyanophycinase [Bacillota bacterium]